MTETQVGVLPIPALQAKASSWPERARALAVADANSFIDAGGLLVDIKTLRAAIARSCDPVVSAAFKAHRQACKQKRDLEAPLLEAEAVIKGRMSAYSEAEERRQREEEARLAREAAEAEEDSRIREATELEAAGERDAAEEVLMAPHTLPPPIAAPATPKVDGVSRSILWSATVTSKKALVDAVAAGDQPLTLLLENMPALNSLARALKGAMNIPGVRAVSKPSIAVRKR